MLMLMARVLAALAFVQDPDPRPAAPLPPPKEEQKDVVIIGQRRESDILDVPSSVTVVTEERIRKTGATDIVQALRATPGIFTQGANFGAYDKIVDLRGYNNGSGNGQRTLVLVDGRKTNGVASSSTDWASIPVENIERIEIVRGPAAALYGDTALAGVVNIITKKGDDRGWTQGSASGGSWSTWRTQANVGHEQEGLRFDVFAGLEGTDGWRDNSEYRGNNVTGRLESRLGPGLLGFVKLGHHDDERERPGTLTQAQIDTLGRNASDKTGSDAEVDENYIDAGVEQALGSLGSIAVAVNYTRYESESFFIDFGGFEAADESDITQLQIKHVVRPKLFGRAAAFTTGFDLSYEGAEAESNSVGSPASTSEYRRRLVGLFTHGELRPVEPFIVSGSVRFDRALFDLERVDGSGFGESFDESQDFDQWSPSIGATWKPIEEVAAYASWGRTFRYPTRDELIGFLSSDPQLKPERASTYEIGVRGRSGALGTASISFFHMDVKDEIYFDSSFGFGSNLNFDEVMHQGFELELSVTPIERLELFATYTYTDTEIEEAANAALEGKEYPVTPRHFATGGASVTFLGAVVTVSARYIGERYLIRDFENDFDQLPDVVVYDARISYTYEVATAFLAVYNLTDREYDDSAGLSGPTIRYNPAPERSLMAGGELRF